MKKNTLKLNIKLEGDKVMLGLVDEKGIIVSKVAWTDKRDLADKLPIKISKILEKNGLKFKNIDKVYFDCDSPYFCKNKKNDTIELSSNDFSGKCSFTAWQTGEVMAKIMNFSLDIS